MYRILIIEDDDTIAKNIAAHFNRWNYETKQIADFKNIMEEFLKFAPQLVLLDIVLPFYNGFYWCQEIRKISKVPILFLSSMNDNMNIVMAMNMGGDDFIAKPFDLQVLTAKLQAVLRRSYGGKLTSHSIECGEVVLNLNDTSVAVRGEKIDLTKNEFLILKTLMEKQGKVVSREEIMERLWGNDEFVDDNTLTVNITRIRKKLEAAGVNDFITTKRGLGYLVGA